MAERVAGQKITLKLVGDRAEFRAYLERVERQFEVARPLMRRWDELTPHQQRKFENVDARHAPLILRMLPDSRASTARPEVRPRERRARTRSTAPTPGDPDAEPKPPLSAPDRLRHAAHLLAWSRALEGAT
jgi:hypothetical protein